MIKLTFDTNCIINLLDFNAATSTSTDELSEIIKYAMDGDVNIAITTTVERDLDKDKDENRKEEMIRKIKMFPIIGAMADENLKRDFKALLFPGLDEKDKHYQNKIADINHLIAHYVNKRDIFITDDSHILKCVEKLRDGFRVIIMNPT